MFRFFFATLLIFVLPFGALADALPFAELKTFRWGMDANELRSKLPRPADVTNQRPNPKHSYVLFRLQNYKILEGVFDLCFWIDPRDGTFRRFHLSLESDKNPGREMALEVAKRVSSLVAAEPKVVDDKPTRYEVHWTPKQFMSRIASVWLSLPQYRTASLTVTFEDPQWIPNDPKF